jgi:serine/threonine protein kinase
MTIMTSLEHESIVKVVAVGKGPYDKQNGKEPKDVFFIVMEYAEHGELFDMLSNTGKFSEEVARYYFKQLLSAVFYLHNTAGICHRDLKPENLLMDSNFNLKMADFGFSIPTGGQKNNGKLTSFKGTLGYMSPEQLAKKTYSGK